MVIMNEKIEYLKKYLKGKDLETGILELEKGIPVQYIVGDVSFYGYDFVVNENTLIPRFETELLTEKTYNYIKKYFDSGVRILDIGTGTGCIAITLSKLLGDCFVCGVDISREALEVANINNKNNDTDVKFFYSDVFSDVDEKFDVIVSNPPYIAYDEEIMDIVYDYEPHTALFAPDNGLYFYDKILSECKNYLNDKFLIAFEIGDKQASSVSLMANKYFDDVNITVLKDYSDRDRFVFIDNIKIPHS